MCVVHWGNGKNAVRVVDEVGVSGKCVSGRGLPRYKEPDHVHLCVWWGGGELSPLKFPSLKMSDCKEQRYTARNITCSSL